MTNNLDIVNAAVTLIVKAALLAARFYGRARKRSLKQLSRMDADDKDKEIIFLRDKVNQQQMQITILQKGLQKKTYKQTIYAPRKALHSLLYGNFSDAQIQSQRETGYRQINALSMAA